MLACGLNTIRDPFAERQSFGAAVGEILGVVKGLPEPLNCLGGGREGVHDRPIPLHVSLLGASHASSVPVYFPWLFPEADDASLPTIRERATPLECAGNGLPEDRGRRLARH